MTDVEIIEAPAQSNSLVANLTRAEIDTQISTAKTYPRHLPTVQKRIMELSCLDQETAEECLYAIIRGKKTIKGPSIRFAEIVKQAYGNCRSGSRVVHVDRAEGYTEAEGVFHDLETNSATTKRNRRRILDSKGKVYTDDMIIVTGNAACSIALRNAVLDGVPKAIWRRAFEQVENIIAGDAKTLAERRESAVKAFSVWGITPEQICAYLEIKTVEEITLDHLVILTGARSAIRNGEETVESIFAPSQVTKGDRANPFATKAEMSSEKPAGETAQVDGGTEAAGSPPESPSRSSNGKPLEGLQSLSDALWEASDIEALEKIAESNRPANVSAKALAKKVEAIHTARIIKKDPDTAKLALADLGIESPEN